MKTEEFGMPIDEKYENVSIYILDFHNCTLRLLVDYKTRVFRYISQFQHNKLKKWLEQKTRHQRAINQFMQVIVEKENERRRIFSKRV